MSRFYTLLAELDLDLLLFDFDLDILERLELSLLPLLNLFEFYDLDPLDLATPDP